jgi:hypothetical protein
VLAAVITTLLMAKVSELRPPDTKIASWIFLNVGSNTQSGGHAAI